MEPWEEAGGTTAPATAKATSFPKAKEQDEPWAVASAPELKGGMLSRAWKGVKLKMDEVFPTPEKGEDNSTFALRNKDTINARKADIDQLKAEREAGQLGTAGEVGYNVPEVVAMANPTSKLTGMLGGAMERGLSRFAPKAVAKVAAPVAAETAGNAAYAGGRSLLSGDDPTQALQEAFHGGLGAGAMTLFGKGVGAGYRRTIGKPASQREELFTQAGLPFTPGQANPGGITQWLENKIGSTPIGGSVRARQGELGAAHFHQKLDDALAPLGFTRKGEGLEAVAAAKKEISDHYDVVTKNTYALPSDVDAAFNAARNAGKGSLGSAKGGKFDKLEKEVRDVIASKVGQTTPGVKPNIDGRTMKDIDIELGNMIRANLQSEPKKARALQDIQAELRKATRGVTPADKTALDATNAARRELFALENASEKALKNEGVPSGSQLYKSLKRNRQTPSALDRAVAVSDASGKLSLPGMLGGAGIAGLGYLGATSNNDYAKAAGYGLGAGALAYTPYGMRATMAARRALRKAPGVVSPYTTAAGREANQE